MKTKLVVLAMVLMMSNIVFAQTTKTVKIGNYMLTDVTITSGKGAMTSGLDTRIDFKTEKNWTIGVQANSDRITVNVGKKWKHFQVIESFGVYKNIPWTGPMLLGNFGPVDVTIWNGIGFAKDKELKEIGYNPQFFFSYEGLGITFLKHNRIGGAILYFGTAPMNWFVSYKRSFLIGAKSKLFAEVTYNHSLNIPMIVIGYNLKLQ